MGPATDVVNPNKLYEYLAAGRTVVSLAYSADLEEFGAWIHLARDRREFVARVGEALAAPRDPAALRAVAMRHSWDARAEALLALVAAAGTGAGAAPAGGTGEEGRDGQG
jgi:glycosyltransferase involved in cell wall biosynthesis